MPNIIKIGLVFLLILLVISNIWIFSNLKNQIDVIENEKINLQTQLNSLQLINADLLKKSNVTVLGIYFSPQGGCEQQVINWINRANKTIHILIYSFTNDNIGDAVERAHQRDIDIEVVFEKSQVSKYSEYWKLQPMGVPVRNDTNSNLMHHKTAIIDGYIILTGSFNWSVSAEQGNNENLMIIQSENLASIFEEEFQKIWNTAAS